MPTLHPLHVFMLPISGPARRAQPASQPPGRAHSTGAGSGRVPDFSPPGRAALSAAAVPELAALPRRRLLRWNRRSPRVSSRLGMLGSSGEAGGDARRGGRTAPPPHGSAALASIPRRGSGEQQRSASSRPHLAAAQDTGAGRSEGTHRPGAGGACWGPHHSGRAGPSRAALLEAAPSRFIPGTRLGRAMARPALQRHRGSAVARRHGCSERFAGSRCHFSGRRGQAVPWEKAFEPLPQAQSISSAKSLPLCTAAQGAAAWAPGGSRCPEALPLSLPERAGTAGAGRPHANPAAEQAARRQRAGGAGGVSQG